MNRLALHRHPPGWLALAAVATAMAVYTWPHRLGTDTLLSTLRQAWVLAWTSTLPYEPAERHRPHLPAGFADPTRVLKTTPQLKRSDW